MSAATVTGRVLTSPKILIGGYDVSGYHDKISAVISKEMLTPQQFGPTGRVRKAGLWDLNLNHSGFWDGGATTIDAVLRELPGSNVLSLCPEAGASGEASCWFCNCMTPKYETGGKVGGMTTFTGTTYLQDGSPVLQGWMLKAGEIINSGNGASCAVGASTASQSIYGVLHVTATTGNANRTLDVIIQSSTEPTFSSPTTRLTFTRVTTSVGAEFLTPITGAITDTYWRASWTRGGTSGTFTLYCLFAIL